MSNDSFELYVHIKDTRRSEHVKLVYEGKEVGTIERNARSVQLSESPGLLEIHWNDGLHCKVTVNAEALTTPTPVSLQFRNTAGVPVTEGDPTHVAIELHVPRDEGSMVLAERREEEEVTRRMLESSMMTEDMEESGTSFILERREEGDDGAIKSRPHLECHAQVVAGIVGKMWEPQSQTVHMEMFSIHNPAHLMGSTELQLNISSTLTWPEPLIVFGTAPKRRPWIVGFRLANNCAEYFGEYFLPLVESEQKVTTKMLRQHCPYRDITEPVQGKVWIPTELALAGNIVVNNCHLRVISQPPKQRVTITVLGSSIQMPGEKYVNTFVRFHCPQTEEADEQPPESTFSPDTWFDENSDFVTHLKTCQTNSYVEWEVANVGDLHMYSGNTCLCVEVFSVQKDLANDSKPRVERLGSGTVDASEYCRDEATEQDLALNNNVGIRFLIQPHNFGRQQLQEPTDQGTSNQQLGSDHCELHHIILTQQEPAQYFCQLWQPYLVLRHKATGKELTRTNPVPMDAITEWENQIDLYLPKTTEGDESEIVVELYDRTVIAPKRPLVCTTVCLSRLLPIARRYSLPLVLEGGSLPPLELIVDCLATNFGRQEWELQLIEGNYLGGGHPKMESVGEVTVELTINAPHTSCYGVMNLHDHKDYSCAAKATLLSYKASAGLEITLYERDPNLLSLQDVRYGETKNLPLNALVSTTPYDYSYTVRDVAVTVRVVVSEGIGYGKAQHVAATAIQQGWRVYAAKKKSKKDSVDMLQQRKHEYNQIVQQEAATLIQAEWRGHHTRSSGTIQEGLDEYHSQSLRTVQEEAAVLIQSNWRCHASQRVLSRRRRVRDMYDDMISELVTLEAKQRATLYEQLNTWEAPTPLWNVTTDEEEGRHTLIQLEDKMRNVSLRVIFDELTETAVAHTKDRNCTVDDERTQRESIRKEEQQIIHNDVMLTYNKLGIEQFKWDEECTRNVLWEEEYFNFDILWSTWKKQPSAELLRVVLVKPKLLFESRKLERQWVQTVEWIRTEEQKEWDKMMRGIRYTIKRVPEIIAERHAFNNPEPEKIGVEAPTVHELKYINIGKHIEERNFIGVQNCLDRGVTPDGRYSKHKTFTQHAAQYGSLEIMKAMLHFGGDVLQVDQTSKRTLLHYSVKNTTFLVFDYLLGQGIDVNCVDISGKSVLELLLKENKGIQWIERALQCNKLDATMLIYYAAMYDRSDVLQWLHEAQQLTPHKQDKQGNTPLHYAAKHKAEAAVRYLLTVLTRDQLNIEDNDGHTALHAATATINNTRLISTLLSHGAEINKGVEKGDQVYSTPISVAVGNANDSAVMHLLQNEAQVYSPHSRNKKDPFENRVLRFLQRNRETMNIEKSVPTFGSYEILDDIYTMENMKSVLTTANKARYIELPLTKAQRLKKMKEEKAAAEHAATPTPATATYRTTNPSKALASLASPWDLVHMKSV